jgi:5'-nucleotidase
MSIAWLRNALLAATLAVPLITPAQHVCGHDHDEDGPALRNATSGEVAWHAEAPGVRAPVKVRLLGFNDFHGQLSARAVGTRPAGGAAVLASYLRAASAGLEDRTFLVHAGDHVGASPPNSALLQDEPSVTFLNQLANRHCRYLEPEHRREVGNGEQHDEDQDEDDRFEGWLSPKCNVVGATGNHEFDEGRGELLRLLTGGNHLAGPFLENPWRGARYPTLVANVVDSVSGRPLLPPYVVKRVDGVPVAFIGLVLRATPTIVTPSGVAGLTFLDEADSANRIVATLRRRGVRTFVVVIHQGGFQTPSFASATGPSPGAASDLADIQAVVTRLDDDVDVVVSGHRHAFTNALLSTASGKQVLVTQAFSSSTAYAQIDLELDPASGDVTSKVARVLTTWGDEGPGLAPDPAAAELTAAATARVAPLVDQVLGTAPAAITRTATPAGEHALGSLIADAQQAAVPGAQAAFMNPGGVRADLPAGPVTWGALFTIQPFGNSLVAMTLTGAQVKTLLEQQWAGQTSPRILQVAGITYSWSASAPVGDRVRDVLLGGVPLDPAGSYRVVVNSFLASGGDNFLVLVQGTGRVGGAVDLDALIAYVEGRPGLVVEAPALGRITRLP